MRVGQCGPNMLKEQVKIESLVTICESKHKMFGKTGVITAFDQGEGWFAVKVNFGDEEHWYPLHELKLSDPKKYLDFKS